MKENRKSSLRRVGGRRANARNVRLYYPYWQYTDLFIFRFLKKIVSVTIYSPTFHYSVTARIIHVALFLYNLLNHIIVTSFTIGTMTSVKKAYRKQKV